MFLLAILLWSINSLSLRGCLDCSKNKHLSNFKDFSNIVNFQHDFLCIYQSLIKTKWIILQKIIWFKMISIYTNQINLFVLQLIWTKYHQRCVPPHFKASLTGLNFSAHPSHWAFPGGRVTKISKQWAFDINIRVRILQFPWAYVNFPAFCLSLSCV